MDETRCYLTRIFQYAHNIGVEVFNSSPILFYLVFVNGIGHCLNLFCYGNIPCGEGTK